MEAIQNEIRNATLQIVGGEFQRVAQTLLTGEATIFCSY
jgi:hypothetical protein